MTVLSRLGSSTDSIGTAMRSHWASLLLVGIALFLLGVFGLYAATLLARTMTLAIAALLVISGALQLAQAFLLRGMPSFALTIALGAAQIVGGIAIYTHPEWAPYAVAATVAALLAIQALAQISMAFRFTTRGKRGISLLAGVIALGAAVASVVGVASAGRASASWGIGVAMLAMGLAYIVIALLYRHDGRMDVAPSRDA